MRWDLNKRCSYRGTVLVGVLSKAIPGRILYTRKSFAVSAGLTEMTRRLPKRRRNHPVYSESLFVSRRWEEQAARRWRPPPPHGSGGRLRIAGGNFGRVFSSRVWMKAGGVMVFKLAGRGRWLRLGCGPGPKHAALKRWPFKGPHAPRDL